MPVLARRVGNPCEDPLPPQTGIKKRAVSIAPLNSIRYSGATRCTSGGAQ